MRMIRSRPAPAHFMDIAMEEARAAADRGEVPVGAALSGPDGQLLARAGNRVEEWGDPSAHAEMQAMRMAGVRRGGQRLADCTLYVTLEPCPMCAAAATHFRVGKIVFGAYDPKGGGVEHGPRLFAQPRCLHRPETVGGVREREAGRLLRDFFQRLRA
ncbi:nucleoside deaminase [Komagataeibacter swingsii]|uniref:tRNA-specific adenosine deaminase n=1 Tax=Komagataeibacter swingsii TaxID=215220 RepID=A0A2V4R0F4_9PROT|nr:nucleoside deaminase [Komagataeibacter swingsii]PYD70321.1 tRNA-specific adenosine deaminase [Komagataeibacter swingsii]